MKEGVIKIIKITLVGMLVLLFLATIPAVFSNSKSINQAKENAKILLDEASKVCNSNCTEYPAEWVSKEKEQEAKLYCINQCSDNMDRIRNEFTDELQSTMFENQYTYRVGQIYCILGLRCAPLEIENFIRGYKP
jgi:hypothetical protein